MARGALGEPVFDAFEHDVLGHQALIQEAITTAAAQHGVKIRAGTSTLP